MPTLSDLRDRYPKHNVAAVRSDEEVLITDSRARMTPCNFVEQKFRAALSTERTRGGRRSPK
jgi:hypothetical protein